MSTQALAICDICGFRYRLKDLKKNSYGMMVCPEDFEGAYDLQNHPQNKSPDTRDNSSYILNPRPEQSMASAVPVSAWLPPL